MSVQVATRRLSEASVDHELVGCFRGFADRVKCFSGGIGDDAILVRPENNADLISSTEEHSLLRSAAIDRPSREWMWIMPQPDPDVGARNPSLDRTRSAELGAGPGGDRHRRGLRCGARYVGSPPIAAIRSRRIVQMKTDLHFVRHRDESATISRLLPTLERLFDADELASSDCASKLHRSSLRKEGPG
jgi:hypothetical protein